MARLEKILVIIIISTMAIMLLVNFQYGSTLLMFVGFLLMALYFFFGFALFNNVSHNDLGEKEAYKGISTLRIIGSIGAGFGLITTIFGIISVFIYLPFGYASLDNGLIMLTITLIVSIIKVAISFDKFYVHLILRMTIAVFIGVTLLYLPKGTLFELKCHGCTKSYIEAQKALINDPDNPELQYRVLKEYERMNKENNK